MVFKHTNNLTNVNNIGKMVIRLRGKRRGANFCNQQQPELMTLTTLTSIMRHTGYYFEVFIKIFQSCKEVRPPVLWCLSNTQKFYLNLLSCNDVCFIGPHWDDACVNTFTQPPILVSLKLFAIASKSVFHSFYLYCCSAVQKIWG